MLVGETSLHVNMLFIIYLQLLFLLLYQNETKKETKSLITSWHIRKCLTVSCHVIVLYRIIIKLSARKQIGVLFLYTVGDWNLNTTQKLI